MWVNGRELGLPKDTRYRCLLYLRPGSLTLGKTAWCDVLVSVNHTLGQHAPRPGFPKAGALESWAPWLSDDTEGTKWQTASLTVVLV